MKYQIDANTIWEDTGVIKITMSSDGRAIGFVRIYNEYKKGNPVKQVVGPFISKESLSHELADILTIYETAHKSIFGLAPLGFEAEII